MKLIVEITKKIGLCNYGGSSAKIGIELDVPDAVAEDADQLRAQLLTLQTMARELVDADLDHQAGHAGPAPPPPLPPSVRTPVIPPERAPAPAPAPSAPVQPIGTGAAGPPVQAHHQPAAHQAAPNPNPTHVNTKAFDGPPQTGKALFKWVKEQEGFYDVALLKYLNGWAKLQEFPGRMMDWDQDQVALGFAEAARKLTVLAQNQGATS